MDNIVFILLLSFVKFYISTVTQDPNSCGVGVCCAGYFLHNGKCTVCSSGRTGKNCSQNCPPGFYGENCKHLCPFECNITCNKVTGKCPPNDAWDSSIETQIEYFLKEKAWIIGGVTFLVLVILCSSIGVIHISQALKCVIINRTNDHTTNQSPQSSNSVRYETDYPNTPSGSLQANHDESRSTKNSSNKREAKPSCEYSKPTQKKRYSFIWKSSVSQEMTLYPDVSEDDEGSEESDDLIKTTSGIQISGLPKKQSFNTFQSLDEKIETDHGANTTYGNVWK
ncbi:uncharacterized protein LOC133175244 [Saccostrea echinata]|uniref:uncharacterized protein LOC133175244 n=1 Tax=Saccostrea echinata TaxID=191078 RepID=UPI002A811753|nr:uncharacterized protein LOC133175244 [Saccostrea echinata]